MSNHRRVTALILICSMTISAFSKTSEANTSEILENLEEMFPLLPCL